MPNNYFIFVLGNRSATVVHVEQLHLELSESLKFSVRIVLDIDPGCQNFLSLSLFFVSERNTVFVQKKNIKTYYTFAKTGLLYQ